MLIVGALAVGIGSYYDRGAVALYGLAMAAGGFVLYMASSIIAKKRLQG